MASYFHSLPIHKIEKITDDCVSLSFAIPTDLKAAFQFTPGQYLTLKIQHNGEELRRSYSICSAPDEPLIAVAVKQMEAGKFSTKANQEFKVGEVIEVMEPMGNFIIKKKANAKKYLFIAAGSGITPIMSLIPSILKQEPDAQLTLLFGNKSRNSIMFKEKIEGLKNLYMNQLSVYHIFTREVADTLLFNGRITKEKLASFGHLLLDYDTMDEVFICGPEEMILAARDYFHENTSIDHHHIHVELFSSPDQPKHVSEAWKKKLEQVDTTQKSTVTVRVDGVAFDMELQYGGESILDAALKHGADLPFACKGGVCATCKAKLVEGEVDMETNYSLEADELSNNFILTCQSHPRSPKVVVDFDFKG